MRISDASSASALARTPFRPTEAATVGGLQRGATVPRPAEPTKADFAEALRRTVSGLADLQAAADRATESVATGDLASLHEAVLAVQKASLAVEFVVAVRSHVVDGIQELLRTQV
jgi:flagellar hook-basal body complex protein FliE